MKKQGLVVVKRNELKVGQIVFLGKKRIQGEILHIGPMTQMRNIDPVTFAPAGEWHDTFSVIVKTASGRREEWGAGGIHLKP